MIYELVTGRVQFICIDPGQLYRNSGGYPNSGPVDEMEDTNSVRVLGRFDRILFYCLIK